MAQMAVYRAKVEIVTGLVNVHNSTLILFTCKFYSYTDVVSCKYYGTVYSIQILLILYTNIVYYWYVITQFTVVFGISIP